MSNQDEVLMFSMSVILISIAIGVLITMFNKPTKPIISPVRRLSVVIYNITAKQFIATSMEQAELYFGGLELCQIIHGKHPKFIAVNTITFATDELLENAEHYLAKHYS